MCVFYLSGHLFINLSEPRTMHWKMHV